MVTSPLPGPEGTVLAGHYRILRKLGSGSVGTVYLARDLSAERELALKVIRTDQIRRDGMERLQREFRAIADLRHPQIAHAYDFGYTESGGLPFYTREYIDGGPLRPGPAGPRGQADPGNYLRPIFDLLDALEYLHAHEILHLDIHAGNLIEASDPRRGGVLIDFGVGLLGRERASSRHEQGAASVPPELLAGEAPGPTADMYSAGRLLLYRLTGQYGGEARLPREIPGWGARLTLELERIVARAIHPEPAHRFGTPRELREALTAVVGAGTGRVPSIEPRELTVGRDAEISLLEKIIHEAHQRQSAVLWLWGPLGSGRSRLITEARWRAQVRALPVADVRFLPGGGSQPAEQQILAGLRGQSRTATSWLAPLATDRGGSSVERARRAASSYFIEEGPPLVLLVDDLENADRESRLLVEALVTRCLRSRQEGDNCRGLALVVTSARPPTRRLVQGDRRKLVRELKRLPAQTARRLLATLLKPLAVPAPVQARLAARAGGNPLRLRQLARFLHVEYGASGRIGDCETVRWVPRTADLTRLRSSSPPSHYEVLQILAAFQRPTERDEIVAATGLAAKTVSAALRGLEREELIASSTQGRRGLYYLTDPSLGEALLSGVARKAVNAWHARAAAWLQKVKGPQPTQQASLARHLVAAGRQREGRRQALEAAPSLARHGLLDSAIRLLELVASRERHWKSRLLLAEEISEIHTLAGDHMEGVASLEPIWKKERHRLGRREGVRFRRRLGVHYHRAGQPGKALPLLEEARRLADRTRDRKELVYILAELAEFHTFRGEYERAETLCREGLSLLERANTRTAGFRETMEVTLRASLGHLELRRLRLDRARREFESALELARIHARPAERAMILNNLGIVHNDRNRFRRASRCFREASRLLAAAGEQRAMIQTSCNLGLIAAKLGDESGSREELAKATRLLKEHPGDRLEFLVGMSRGIASHLLGSSPRAIEELGKCLPLGRDIGDDYLVGFIEVYLAEARILCGHYQEARQGLQSVLSRVRDSENRVLQRMAASRLLGVERLLGRSSAAESIEAELGNCPPSGIELLEAWNELFLAAANTGNAATRSRGFSKPLKAFRRIRIPAGIRFSRLGLLNEALDRQDVGRIRSLLIELEKQQPTSHRILRVMEPLAAGEAAFFLGETERASRYQQQAAAAIVGLPFLELDWKVEFLRARLASRAGNRDVARHHLHRALQTRDLLVRYLPARWRESFLAHARFKPLQELQARLAREWSPPVTPFRPRESSYGRMVGGSEPMRKLYGLVDRLRATDLPVLIAGETGTGKELVAEALHRSSSRRDGPYYSLHCSSLPSQLFESELFGYEAGAFTGAEGPRPGLLEHLRGGTLLLDEITQLPVTTQAKLLQVLDTRLVRPLGSLETRPVDVRFLASTSASAEAAVQAGQLRQDLYYRLRGAEIRVPPLRERIQDLPLLLRHFLKQHASRLERQAPSVSREAIASLEEHGWPGNVRELEALVLRLVLEASPAAAIGPEDIRALLTPTATGGLFPAEVMAGRDLKVLHRELDRTYLLRLFHETRGNVPAMLEALGIRRSNFYTWLRRVGLDVEEMRKGLER